MVATLKNPLLSVLFLIVVPTIFYFFVDGSKSSNVWRMVGTGAGMFFGMQGVYYLCNNEFTLQKIHHMGLGRLAIIATIIVVYIVIVWQANSLITNGWLRHIATAWIAGICSGVITLMIFNEIVLQRRIERKDISS